MTINTNDIKMNIINIISKIDDVDQLGNIYKSLEQYESENTPKPNIHDDLVEVTEGLSYKEILAEQNYKPISFEEFNVLAAQIEWEHTLEELLAELD